MNASALRLATTAAFAGRRAARPAASRGRRRTAPASDPRPLLPGLRPSRCLYHPSVTQPRGEDITAYLHAWEQGDDRALEALLPMVYAELRAIAARHIRAERPGH